MVGGLEVRADLFECEPGWFELTACVERCLIRVVLILWISTRAEGVYRQRPDAWSKLDHADVSSPRDAVSPLLPALRRSINREHRAIITIHTANSEARLGIVKILVLALIDTLQTINLAPRNFP